MVPGKPLVVGLFTLLVLTAALLTPPPAGPIQPSSGASKNCASCHRGFHPINIKVATPTHLGVNLTDSIQMELAVPWKHEARYVKVRLELPSDAKAELSSGQSTNFTVDSIHKYDSVTRGWEMKGLEQGSFKAKISLETTSYYKHKRSSNHNSFTQSLGGYVNLNVVKLTLSVNPSILLSDPATYSSFGLTLSSGLENGRITDFSMSGVGALEPYVMIDTLPQFLSPGEQREINITLLKDHPAGELVLEYKLADGTPANLTIQVLNKGGDWGVSQFVNSYSLDNGALYGWLLLAAMVAAMAQGFTKHTIDLHYRQVYGSAKNGRRRKRRVDRGKQKQLAFQLGEWQRYWWWLHVSLLSLMLIFVYLHILLTFNAGYPIIYSKSMIGGIIAIFLLLAVGFEGLYPRYLKVRWGGRGWKRSHALLAALALGLGLAHSVILRYIFFS